MEMMHQFEEGLKISLSKRLKTIVENTEKA